MIRDATIQDFDAVERMLHDFHSAKASQFPSDLYTKLHFRNTFRSFLSNPSSGMALIFQHEGEAVGCLLAGASLSPFAPILVAEEALWWVDPSHRGPESLAMLDAYERWAESVGAKIVGLSFFGSKVPSEYKKRGFSPIEQRFAKAL